MAKVIMTDSIRNKDVGISTVRRGAEICKTRRDQGRELRDLQRR